MDRAKAIFAKALTDLESRHGVALSDIGPDELVDLARAAERAANPFRTVNADAAGFPVRVCDGVWFWRLTIGAGVWLDELESNLPEGTKGERYRLALIFAVAHARDPMAFPPTDDLKAVEKAVKRFCRGIAATPQEVNAALDEVLKIRPNGRRRDDNVMAAADYAAICARLEGQTGIPASEWLWKRSSAYAMKVYADLHEFASAYSATTKRNPASMRDELDAATEALNLVKLRISRKAKPNG